MIPYLAPPSIEVAGVRLHAFGLLVGLALLAGGRVFLYRARRQKLDAGFARVFLFGVAAAGYASALLLYWLLFSRFGGISSFGGIAGGLAAGYGLMAWFRVPAAERWMHLDNLGFAFPIGWIFGRAGCALAHDHVGPASTSFLAVRFPQGPHLDLGLLELLFTVLLAAIFLVLDRFWLDRLGNASRIPYFPLFLAAYGGFRLWRGTLEAAPVDTGFAVLCLAGAAAAQTVRGR
jgi:prolipoprotein diacylglyceryltransferase